MTEATQRTSDSGVSIWLDDLSRSRIESGSLQDLIANKNVVGVTTNPSICLLYTSPSPRDRQKSRMPSSA